MGVRLADMDVFELGSSLHPLVQAADIKSERVETRELLGGGQGTKRWLLDSVRRS